eukprot:CAMPEP_0118939890 /NCGR_PEP_ID=MMETSP1169-20130426/30111_1 /TAXON_ID=36882 /ORGANISM="Pyramimonas obovata, Strain CCMP722" /LENGTH=52 /DNA_ID=CAMNT_0006884255 /DNA_START=27 /DNA_END=182 /DNA_ORIENTATION=-
MSAGEQDIRKKLGFRQCGTSGRGKGNTQLPNSDRRSVDQLMYMFLEAEKWKT